MTDINVCDKRRQILDARGHLLVEGGPGSGKTTIALLKAQQIIHQNDLFANQKILFLSFARATISRVAEHARALLSKEYARHLEINTYHGFTWSLIRSFGYLISAKRNIRLVTPPNAAAMMAKIPDNEKVAFQENLYREQGLLCFDLFAQVAGEILRRSKKISAVVSGAYPIILVDEFQDTNDHEWEIVKILGQGSKIIALADLDQRIYDFRGASLTRIPEFNDHFRSTRVDLGKENHRSGNTDIAVYGDDILTGANIGKAYQQVQVIRYKKNFQDSFAQLRFEIIKSITRLKRLQPDNKWSIAILVKARRTTLLVSSALSQETKTTRAIPHEVLIDPAGPALAAGVIACLLEPADNAGCYADRMLSAVISHIRGRKPDGPSKADVGFIDALEKYSALRKVTGKNRQLFIDEMNAIAGKRESMVLKGAPMDDWIAIRKLFNEATHEHLKNVYADALFLRLLNKGAMLNEQLSEKWRTFQRYEGAMEIVDTALLQEHFSMANRDWRGIFVMTMHKSKGKEFDEVIIWEDEYRAILHSKATPQDVERTRLAMRVAVTRARSKTTILTCQDRPCPLL